jgi:hypothetical protein
MDSDGRRGVCRVAVLLLVVGCSDGAMHSDAEPDDGTPEETAAEADTEGDGVAPDGTLDGEGGESPDDGAVADADGRRDIDHEWSPVDGFAEGEARDETGDDTSDEGDDGAECTALLDGDCNPVEQCGCGSAERCVLDQVGPRSFTEICVADGADPYGTPCAGVDNCVRGNQCFPFRSYYRWDYQCVRFCYDNRQCEGHSVCMFSPWCGDCLGPDAPYRFCSDSVETCDVFTGDGCAFDETCFLAYGGTYCDGTDMPCHTDCPAVGWHCIDDPYAATVTCLKYCRLDGTPPDCSDVPGTVCGGLGHPEIGACWPAD